MQAAFHRWGWLLLLSCSGCAMCASPYDCQYMSYGGLRERTDMVHGRVGSVYNPATEINHVVPKTVSALPAEEIVQPGDTSPTPAKVKPDTAGEKRDPAGAKRAQPPSSGPGSDLPDLPQGTMELPDLDADKAPANDGSNELPDREAQRDTDWTHNAFSAY